MTTISQVMTRGVQIIRPHDTLQRAAQLMDELNVGALPVCEGKELVGMITDRDITVRATAAGMEPGGHEVREVMKQMGDVQIRRLPVLDQTGQIVGIVSMGDLATRQSGHTDELLRDISYPSEPDRPDANAASR